MTNKVPGPAQGRPQNASAKNVTVRTVGPLSGPNIRKPMPAPARHELTRAATVYGAAASVFAVLTVFMFFKGMWVTGLIMIVPTFCLAGFCWYYMKP